MNSTKAQFVRFAAVGAVGTALHYTILVGLVEFADALPALGALAGFSAGALANYLIARRYVFSTSRPHRLALPRFIAVAIVGATISVFMVGIASTIGVHYFLAQIAATMTTLVLTFHLNKHWTFPITHRGSR